jgi:hypothetical protein
VVSQQKSTIFSLAKFRQLALALFFENGLKYVFFWFSSHLSFPFPFARISKWNEITLVELIAFKNHWFPLGTNMTTQAKLFNT